jgi:hypothetical protein
MRYAASNTPGSHKTQPNGFQKRPRIGDNTAQIIKTKATSAKNNVLACRNEGK